MPSRAAASASAQMRSSAAFEAFLRRVMQVDEARATASYGAIASSWRSLRCDSTGEFSMHVADVVRAVGEDVALAADLRRQRHHAVLAQRIDRRVGDLRERLAEIVVQRPHLLAQHRHRHVVAHRADGFLLGLGERAQHLLALLAGELEQLLEAAQRLARRTARRPATDRSARSAGRSRPACSQLLVRRARAVDAVDGVGVEQLAACTGRRRSSRPGRACPWRRSPRAAVPHAGFGGDQEVAVARCSSQRAGRRPLRSSVQAA